MIGIQSVVIVGQQSRYTCYLTVYSEHYTHLYDKISALLHII